MADKDASGILTALEPVFDQIVITQNGRHGRWTSPVGDAGRGNASGPDRVLTAATLADAVETATALVEEAGAEAGLSGAGMVITGSVVTAGAARTLFGRTRDERGADERAAPGAGPVEELPRRDGRHADSEAIVVLLAFRWWPPSAVG